MTTADSSRVPRLFLTNLALISGTRYTLDALPLETGGIMLGWHDATTIVVTDLIEVGDPHASTHGYVRNEKSAQRSLSLYRAETFDPNVGYVGEWHSHPAQQPPSGIDYKTLRNIAFDTDYQVGMAVFSANFDGSVTPHLVTATRYGNEVTVHRRTGAREDEWVPDA